MRRPIVLAAVLGACLLPATAHAQTAADPAAVARGERARAASAILSAV